MDTNTLKHGKTFIVKGFLLLDTPDPYSGDDGCYSTLFDNRVLESLVSLNILFNYITNSYKGSKFEFVEVEN